MADRDVTTQGVIARAIRAEIAAAGPMRLDRFMALANTHYYATRDPLGRVGDFTTAPEMTQAFGELLGLWAAAVWEVMGAPDPVLLVELGPGRGTMMADALRAIARAAPGFRSALRVHLVETSPALRDAQAARLGGAVEAWHDDLVTLPAGPMLLVANEFLDALPIRRLVDGGEIAVTLRDGVLAFTTMPSGLAGAGEVSEGALAVAALLGQRLAREGGVALFIDYGPVDATPDDSLQAVRNHATADPLAEPGEADLTAHVDFAAFAAAARAAGGGVQGPVPQGEFLRRLGLPERTAILCRHAAPAQAGLLQSGARRLMDADAMGLLFKAIVLCDPRLPSLPGTAA